MQVSKLFFCAVLSIAVIKTNAQRISFELLKGSWQTSKESRDIKIFGNYKLSFNGYNARCYLKSLWNFDSDSTGTISIPASEFCNQAVTMPFKYQLLEAAGYGGPVYKLPVLFENGFSDVLYIHWDGKEKLLIGYNQVLEGSMASDNRVSINYTLKKKK